jgi:hypothetical protein
MRVNDAGGLRQAGPAAALAGAALLLAACAAPAPPVAELNAGYELAADFEAGGAAEQAALDRVQDYFTRLDPAAVRAKTAAVYAPQAYLNDTLATVQGAEAIEAYFAGTTTRARLLDVRFLDRARAGTDYYVRWQMTVEADGLNGGKPVVTYGVTQFRFDAEGRVLIHKDFWDAGTGLYEQLPGLGGLVRRVRGSAHPD